MPALRVNHYPNWWSNPSFSQGVFVTGVANELSSRIRDSGYCDQNFDQGPTEFECLVNSEESSKHHYSQNSRGNCEGQFFVHGRMIPH